MTICSTAFITLGRAQARALGRSRPADRGDRRIRSACARARKCADIAEKCVDDIARLVGAAGRDMSGRRAAAAARAARFEAPDDLDAINRLYRERRWGDGLPVVPPTRRARRAHAAPHAARAATRSWRAIAPGFGAATVERIAINAVMAGCDPEYLPVLIAATEAVAAPEFNLQGIQATTNPVAVWLIVNGPVGEDAGASTARSTASGQGAWANATIGRALRLILQNIGGALPGEMDRATQGQPGKYTFCCAENEEASPWEPLHVERGFARGASTVTVVGAEGTLNMNTPHQGRRRAAARDRRDHAAPAEQRLHATAASRGSCVGPEHAEIFSRAGLAQGGGEAPAVGRLEDARRAA